MTKAALGSGIQACFMTPHNKGSPLTVSAAGSYWFSLCNTHTTPSQASLYPTEVSLYAWFAVFSYNQYTQKLGTPERQCRPHLLTADHAPPPQFNSQVVHISDEIGASMSQSLHRELGCKEFNSLCCNQTQMGPNLKEWQFSIQ